MINKRSILVSFILLSCLISAVSADWTTVAHDSQNTGMTEDMLILPGNPGGLTYLEELTGGSGSIYNKPLVVDQYVYMTDYTTIRKYDITTGASAGSYTLLNRGIKVPTQVSYNNGKLFYVDGSDYVHVVSADTMTEFCSVGPYNTGYGVRTSVTSIPGTHIGVFAGNSNIWYKIDYTTSSCSVSTFFDCTTIPNADDGAIVTADAAAETGKFYVSCVAEGTTLPHPPEVVSGFEAYLGAFDTSGTKQWEWKDTSISDGLVSSISVDAANVYIKTGSSSSTASYLFWVPKTGGSVHTPTITKSIYYINRPLFQTSTSICTQGNSYETNCYNKATGAVTNIGSLSLDYPSLNVIVAGDYACGTSTAGFKCIDWRTSTPTVIYSSGNDGVFSSYGVYSYLMFYHGNNLRVYRQSSGAIYDPGNWNPIHGNNLNTANAVVSPVSWTLTRSWSHTMNYPDFAPIIYNNAVYVFDSAGEISGENELDKFDLNTGAMVWSVPPHFPGYYSTAFAVGNGMLAATSLSNLYVYTDGSGGNNDRICNAVSGAHSTDYTAQVYSPLIIPDSVHGAGSSLVVVGTKTGWSIVWATTPHVCNEAGWVSCSTDCNGHTCTAGGEAATNIPAFDGTSLYLPCIAKDSSFPRGTSPYGDQAQIVVTDTSGNVQWRWKDTTNWASPDIYHVGAPIIDTTNGRIYIAYMNSLTSDGRIFAISLSTHNTLWTADVTSIGANSREDALSFDGTKICTNSYNGVVCFSTSGALVNTLTASYMVGSPVASGTDICTPVTSGSGNAGYVQCGHIAGGNLVVDFTSAQTTDALTHSLSIGSSSANPDVFNLIFTNDYGMLQRYTGVVSGVTTTTSTTTTTLPQNQVCYTVQDYDTGAMLDSVTIGMIDQTTPAALSCTTVGGQCCVTVTTADEYKVSAQSSAYDTLTFPNEAPYPSGTDLISLNNYPTSSPTSILIKLKKWTTTTYCRSDIPFYRMACWTWNRAYDHPVSVTYSILSSMNSYSIPIYTTVYSPPQGVNRDVIYLNKKDCDDYLESYYDSDSNCIKSFLDYDILAGVCVAATTAPFPTPCDPKKLFRTVDWTTAIANHPYINYKLSVSTSSSSIEYSNAIKLLQCYQDSDCIGTWNVGYNNPTCDIVTHTCNMAAMWDFAKDPYTTYMRDRPVMNIEVTQPSICISSGGLSCTQVDASVLKYSLYRSDGSSWREITYGHVPYSSIFQDDFSDVCSFSGSHPQCASMIGKSISYKVEVYYPNSNGVYILWQSITSSSKVVANCDPSDSSLSCSSYTCLAPSGKGCGVFTDCGSSKACTTDADCSECRTVNGNGLQSDTFCYQATHTCKPLYKGCTTSSDCTGVDVGTNGIWNRNPTNKQYCPTTGSLTMFCNKERNSVLHTQSWNLGSTITYSNIFSASYCECKSSEQVTADRPCTENDQCLSGNCAQGGVVPSPATCAWSNIKSDPTTNVNSCYVNGAMANNYCYSSSSIATTGSCISIGACSSASVIGCDIADMSKDDIYCRNTIFAQTALNDDLYYAYCQNTMGSTKGVCVPASSRVTCGSTCIRDVWCFTGNTCQGYTQNSYGFCLQSDGTCPTATTTTTIPSNRKCTYNSQNCQNSQIYTVAGVSKTFFVTWRDVIYGSNTVKVPCLDGRGCPIINTGGDGPAIDSYGQYLYSSCGCVKTDGTENNLMNRYTCDSSNRCDPLLLVGAECDSATASSQGLPSGYYGDRACDSFNCVGDSHTADSGSSVKPMCMPWYQQCDMNAVISTPDTQLSDPEHYCHIEVGSADYNGVHTWLGGPDDSPGGAMIYGGLTNANSNVKRNSQYCDMEAQTLLYVPDFKCHNTLPDGSSCYKDYQCQSQNCYQSVCTNLNRKKQLGESCVIYNILADQNPDLRWDSQNNGEGTVSDVIWGDNCDRNGASGPLYCDPCDQKIDKTDDGSSSPQTKCDNLQIKNLAGGKCYPAQKNGQWCYSNSQCNQNVETLGGVQEMLYCGGGASCDKGKGVGSSDVPTNDGKWINNYCSTSDSTTFARHCTYTPVGQCYHDYVLTGGSADKFDQQQDEVCWRSQHLPGGNLPATDDLFCDDSDLCKNVGDSDSLNKPCEQFSVADRSAGKVVHITGTCIKDYCPAATTPYISSACMRAPGYTDHHVASAGSNIDLSLVYCDGVGGISGDTDQGGMCKWRKDLGAKCSGRYECKADYSCIGGICKNKACTSSSDCDLGQFCDSGICHVKPTYAITISAVNGLVKPNPSTNEFTEDYDFVISCNKNDNVFKFDSDSAIRMKYQIAIPGSQFGDEQWFGNTQNTLSGSGTGAIDLCSMNSKLNANTLEPSHTVYYVKFIPIISGVENPNLILPKKVLVLSRSLSLNVFRCDEQHIVSEAACKGYNSAGKAYDSNTFILKMNNTIATGQQGTSISTYKDDPRTIKCYGNVQSNGQFPNVLLPRTADDETAGTWAGSPDSIIEDWSKNKYYRCYDMYGTIYEGTVIFNPAEALFNYQFDPRQRLFWILVVLIGIPTLVLAGTRAKKG